MNDVIFGFRLIFEFKKALAPMCRPTKSRLDSKPKDNNSSLVSFDSDIWMKEDDKLLLLAFIGPTQLNYFSGWF